MTDAAAVVGNNRQHGLVQGMLALWDLSEQPLTNDREAKLGSMNGALATSIVGFDPDTLRTVIADGVSNPIAALHVSRLFEPDNWTPRVHADDGHGRDVVQALRLIVDHDHPHDERTNRGTMVVDQCDIQRWAWLNDGLRVVNLGAEVTDNELRYTGAGFLAALYETDEIDPLAHVARGALALNLAKRGMAISDGVKVAQLWHVLHIAKGAGAPPAASSTVAVGKPAPAGGGGGTVAVPSEVEPCPDETQETGCLRGDTPFAVGNNVADFAIETVPDLTPTGKLMYGALHISATRSTMPPANELDEDELSNQPILERQIDTGLRVHVRMAEYALSPGGAGIPVELSETPTPAGDGGTKFPPTALVYRGFNVLEFPDGQITSVARSVALPQHFGDIDIDVEVPYRLDRLLAGAEQIDVALMYRVFPNIGDDVPSAWVSSAASLVSGDNAAAVSSTQAIVFSIPAVGFADGVGGGQLVMYFMRRSDDTATLTNFQLIGGIKVFERSVGDSGPVSDALIEASP